MQERQWITTRRGEPGTAAEELTNRQQEAPADRETYEDERAQAGPGRGIFAEQVVVPQLLGKEPRIMVVG